MKRHPLLLLSSFTTVLIPLLFILTSASAQGAWIVDADADAFTATSPDEYTIHFVDDALTITTKDSTWQQTWSLLEFQDDGDGALGPGDVITHERHLTGARVEQDAFGIHARFDLDAGLVPGVLPGKITLSWAFGSVLGDDARHTLSLRDYPYTQDDTILALQRTIVTDATIHPDQAVLGHGEKALNITWADTLTIDGAPRTPAPVIVQGDDVAVLQVFGRATDLQQTSTLTITDGIKGAIKALLEGDLRVFLPTLAVAAAAVGLPAWRRIRGH